MKRLKVNKEILQHLVHLASQSTHEGLQHQKHSIAWSTQCLCLVLNYTSGLITVDLKRFKVFYQKNYRCTIGTNEYL